MPVQRRLRHRGVRAVAAVACVVVVLSGCRAQSPTSPLSPQVHQLWKEADALPAEPPVDLRTTTFGRGLVVRPQVISLSFLSPAHLPTPLLTPPLQPARPAGGRRQAPEPRRPHRLPPAGLRPGRARRRYRRRRPTDTRLALQLLRAVRGASRGGPRTPPPSRPSGGHAATRALFPFLSR